MPTLSFRYARTAAACAAILATACSSVAKIAGGSADPLLNIQGQITGLVGSGLVLQNNGGGDLTFIGGSAGFVFLGIKSGASYVVTVKTQPTAPSQTCVVTNGTGTVGDNPPTNLLVTCTTNLFEVRGTVSGLTGAGLRIALNAGTPLAIAAGTASFTFGSIVSGTQYAVTIDAQPSGQTCSINGAAGTVGVTAVTNIAVSCGAGAGSLTVGGAVSGLGTNGLTLLLNGGAPLAISVGATAFTFPDLLRAGDAFSVVTNTQPSGPRQTCVLGRAKGRLTQSVSNVNVRCFPNGSLDSYGGTYATVINNRRQFLTVWLDGSYSSASRLDDATCANSGNGLEYGTYRRTTAGAVTFYIAVADNNGTCGLWKGGNVPSSGGGFEGTMVRTGNALVLVSPIDGTFTFTAVESVPTSLVGAFTRADGLDGSFVVFEADGTYLFQETQDALGAVGYERGCYTVAGSSFTTSLASTCRPNGLSALDFNGTNGFSGKNGAAITFAITSATTATIDGVQYVRISPIG